LIYGPNQTIGAVFIVGANGIDSYYGKEGKRMTGTRVTIKKIFKDRVLLSQPGRKDTEIYFRAEEFLTRWRTNNYIDPIELKKQELKNRPKIAPPPDVEVSADTAAVKPAEEGAEDEEE